MTNKINPTLSLRTAVTLFVMLLTSSTAWATLTGHTGTKDDPYIIENATTLLSLQNNVNNGNAYEDKYFVQTDNIDLGNTSWTPIGKDSSHPFKGHYDGGGYQITGLNVTTNGQYAGLFGYIVGGQYQGSVTTTMIANVNNVVLVNPTITVTATSSAQYAGAVVGYAGTCTGVSYNTIIGGTVSYTGIKNHNTNNSYAGGVVGYYSSAHFSLLTYNKVSGITVSGGGISGGVTGYAQYSYHILGNVVDANVSSAEFDLSTDIHTYGYRQGVVVGYCSMVSSGSPSDPSNVNYYHSVNGLTAYGANASYHSFNPVADGGYNAQIYTITTSDNLTVSDGATVIIGTKSYFAADATATLSTDDSHIFKDSPTVSGTGASVGNVATNRKSATVTVGTADVTVSANLAAIAGTCGENATWRVSDENNDGTYETLHIEGTGDMANYETNAMQGTVAPWLNFRGTITAVNIANGITSIGDSSFANLLKITEVTLPSSVSSIGGLAFQSCPKLTRINIQKTDGVVYLYSNAFDGCYALSAIVVPTPALAVEYKQKKLNGTNTDNYWRDYANKLRVPFGDYLFQVDGTTAADAAYAITNGDDLRNLSSAVYATSDISVGKTFRQTADIDLSSGGNFYPIGGYRSFNGTYDGKGHKISGLSVNEKRGELGLFGYVRGATIRNVVLISPTIRATDGGGADTGIGAIVGDCLSGATNIVENCHVINPTLTIVHPSEYTFLGVIVGRIWFENNTVSNCYYYDNTNDYAVIGEVDGNVTRVGRARKVTLGEGVSVRQSASEPENGFVYDGDNYYREGLELTFNTPEGYDFTYSVNGSAISGSTYTINSDDADANISVVMEPLNEISLKASKINDLYWSTFYCGGAGYRIADGEEACAYTATVGEDAITLHLLGKVIPSGTAVIIVGEDGNISMNRDDVSAMEHNVGNDLRGVDVATARTSLTSNDSETLYMLSNKNNNFGFHSFAAANVPARKAFFTVPSSANARAFSMVFEDDATVLGKLRIANDESSVYDLNGRKVSGKNLKPGVYVKGGKKVVIK